MKFILIFLILMVGLHLVSRSTSDSDGGKKPKGSKEYWTTEQRGFFDVAAEYSRRSKSASNDLQRVILHKERANKLCDSIPGLFVDNWAGRVTYLSTDNGHAALDVNFGGVRIGTIGLDRSFAKQEEKETAIDVDDELYEKLSEIKVGQIVRFSGNFIVTGDEYCIAEQYQYSDAKEKLMEPYFLFKFHDFEIVANSTTPDN